jgi:LAO/AO transport system kinase
MEIADVFVVNKADREGADRLVSAIETTLALHAYREGEWRPPILKTVATEGRGISELVETIWRFRDSSRSADTGRRRTRVEHRLRELVSERFMDHLEQRILRQGELASLVERVASRELDPYTAAADLLTRAVRWTKTETRPPC